MRDVTRLMIAMRDVERLMIDMRDVMRLIIAMRDVILFILGIVVDMNQALRFAMDVARGMEFLHSMEPMIPNMLLTSKHVMVSIVSCKHCVNVSGDSILSNNNLQEKRWSR